MTPFFRFVDSVGDGTGSKTMNVDGSVTPQVFKLAPLAGQRLRLERGIFFLEDAGNFTAAGFGAGAALATGVSIEVREASDDSVRVDLTSGVLIKGNAGFSRYCHDVNYFQFGAGDNFLSARWTWSKAGAPLPIGGDGYLAVTISDDLTGLVDFTLAVQGVYT